ncbi:alpha/beta fold hydrolase, partial [Burkholderia multivorans]
STYRTLFAELADDYELRYIERIGHDRRYPVTRDWPHLVEQLLDDIGSRYERPVWLVGHSLGGYLSLMAALKKPHWVRGVVMLDSPIIAGWRAGALRATQWAGLDERLSPAAATRNRRTHWASRDEAWRHFREKPAFARWDERMLADYIDYGIPQVDADGTRALAFDRQIEYLIYRTLPHTLGPRL